VEKSKHKFSKIFCFCPTEEINHHYQKDGLVDKNCIFSEWNEQWIIDLSKKLTHQNANKEKKDMKFVLLILDDMFDSNDVSNSPALKSIFMRSRHYGLGIICCSQYLYNLPPVCRNNMDWVILGQMNKQSIEISAQEYLSGNLDKQEFIKLYHRSTKDYHFLIINCNSIKDNDDLNQIYGIVKSPI
jgi:hypothetical protein